MPPAKKSANFDWEKGSQLKSDMYDALGNVAETGFKKLADGILADPLERKKRRKEKLKKNLILQNSEIVIEESESGLHTEYTPSEASRLIHKDSKTLRGINFFKKSQPPKNKKPS